VPRDTESLPSALASLDPILAATRGDPPRQIALFLDYDGTLTPIVERPELARLSHTVRELVAGLARSVDVAIVSGRGLDDVRRLVDLSELIYAGSHGFEIEGPEGSGLRHREGEQHRPAIEAAERQLRADLALIEGALVERKACSVAVHYRLVAADAVSEVTGAVDRALARHPELHRGHGKCVYELQPALDWHKGEAVGWLLDRLEAQRGPLLPLYLGDDVTDENAFRALPPHGIGIVVCETDRQTEARYRLRDTDEVRQFLERLLSHLPRGAS
jgi:trehalose-phosphatase